ncbi:MAG: hypothetical protein IKO96_05995, partial [Spirochaetales bacterium]|nr:hypothetical protein [Spirochaetales bacterium]
LNAASGDFNRLNDELEELHKAGKVFVIAPSEPVEVSRFEGDMEKLGELYWLGHKDAEDSFDALREYLKK